MVVDALAAGGGLAVAYAAIEVSKMVLNSRNGKKDPCERCRIETHDTHQMVHQLGERNDRTVDAFREKLDEVVSGIRELTHVVEKNGAR